jgi:hypothetical protein
VDWLKSLFAGVSLKGVTSRRLASVVIGGVLAAWLNVALRHPEALPEIPATVLLLVVVLLGTSAVQSNP